MRLLLNVCRGIVVTGLLYLVLSELVGIFGVKKVLSL